MVVTMQRSTCESVVHVYMVNSVVHVKVLDWDAM